MEKLRKIQAELKAPKSQLNKFGNYNYRNCEDILEALKPLLLEHGCTLTLTDKIKQIGNLIYVEATARFSEGENIPGNFKTVKAQAGIDPNRKGMDIAQSFGSSSSYARKYALNGLFLIDDTKDPDSQKPPKKEKEDKKPKASQVAIDKAKELIMKGEDNVIDNMKSSMILTKAQLNELEEFDVQYEIENP